MTSSLRLEADEDRPVVDHLEEAAARLALVLLCVGVLTPFLVQHTERWLMDWIDSMALCESCMSVFEPGAWIGLRWTAALIGAFLLISPLALYQVVSFARPALLPIERRRLMMGLTIMASMGLLSTYFVLQVAFPWAYENGAQGAQDVGLSLALDAVEMMHLALASVWLVGLTTATLSTTLLAGIAGLIHAENHVQWRTRVHLPVVLLLISTTWTAAYGVRWPLALVLFLILELGLWPFARRAPNLMQEVLDQEGRRRRLLVVDCSCEGALRYDGRRPESPFGHHSAVGLCRRNDERDGLMEDVLARGATDLVIGGCDTICLPAAFKDAVASAGCRLRGLDLRSVEFDRTTMDGERTRQQRDLALASMVDPWSVEAVIKRREDALSLLPPTARASLAGVVAQNETGFHAGQGRVETS